MTMDALGMLGLDGDAVTDLLLADPRRKRGHLRRSESLDLYDNEPPVVEYLVARHRHNGTGVLSQYHTVRTMGGELVNRRAHYIGPPLGTCAGGGDCVYDCGRFQSVLL